MNRHPIDSTALIFGLLFGLAGMAILIDETADVDATLVTGAVVGALGIAFIATLVTRQVRVAAPAGSPTPPSVPVPPPVPSPPTTDPIVDAVILDEDGAEVEAAGDDESTQD